MNLEIVSLRTRNSLNMSVTIYYVRNEGINLGEFYSKENADLFVEAYEARHTPMLADSEPNHDSKGDI